MTRHAALLLAGGVLTVAAVTATLDIARAQQQPPQKYRYEQRIMADPPAAASTLKKRIAVARFDDSTTVENSPFGVMDPETKQKHQNDDIDSALSKDLAVIRNGFTERMITALFATDRFLVVERRDIHRILNEQHFAMTDRAALANPIVLGEVLTAQYLITGLVTLDHGESADTTSDSDVELSLPIPGSRFRTTAGSGRATRADVGATEGGSEAPSMGDRSLLTDVRTIECPRRRGVPARYAFHMRVYDVSTSQIVSAVRVSADNQWCLVKAAVHQMIVQMEKFPWKARVTGVDGDRIQVDGGRDVNMTFGSQLTHQATATGVQLVSAPTEFRIVEINDASSIARSVAPPRSEVRVGDWVVFNAAQTSPR